jgi:hypothetical protein
MGQEGNGLFLLGEEAAILGKGEVKEGVRKGG